MTAGHRTRGKYQKALRSDVGCKLYGPTPSKPRFRVLGSSGREVTGRAIPLDRSDDPVWKEEERWANDQFDRAVAWARAQAQDGTLAATPIGAPTPPTLTAATPGNGTVTLTWSAPSSSGGAALTGYLVVETGVDVATVTAPTTTYRVTSLTNGTTYHFSVEAQNGVGTSAASNTLAATPGELSTGKQMAATPTGKGWWLAAPTGKVAAYGTAATYGSMAGKALDAPIVGIASTPTAKGYFEVGADGGVFCFGDAQFRGSMGGKPLDAPIVGMAVDQATGGYWLVAADGGIFSFTAPFFGSMGGKPLNQPVVGMAATSRGAAIGRLPGMAASSPSGMPSSMAPWAPNP